MFKGKDMQNIAKNNIVYILANSNYHYKRNDYELLL